MAFGTTALLGLKMLTADAEAGQLKDYNVDAPTLMARCGATEAGVDRGDARAVTEEFNQGLSEALKDPSKRELRRALAFALWERITHGNGSKVPALVTPEEIDARLASVEATLADDLIDPATVDPNRAELLEARQATAVDDAILDLVLNVNGRPISLRDLVDQNPDFLAYYKFLKAMDYAEEFKREAKLDCTDAIAYTLENGAFPAYDVVPPKAEAPQWVINVYPEYPAGLKEQLWRINLGEEGYEFDNTWLLVDDQADRAKGLDRFARRGCGNLNNFEGTRALPKVYIEQPKKAE